jgi:hypothetical protein
LAFQVAWLPARDSIHISKGATPNQFLRQCAMVSFEIVSRSASMFNDDA